MSIANQFDCRSVRIDTSSKVIYMLGYDSSQYTFSYNIACTASIDFFKIKFYFSIDHDKVMVIYKQDGLYKCFTCKFWLENEIPILATHLFQAQKDMMTCIADEFREQYMSIIIDRAINS